MYAVPHEALVAPIARAVKDDRVTGLAGVLSRLFEAGAFGPELFLPPHPAHYGRKLLHRADDGSFIVVAMTWGPGQGSVLHDHAGLWGAEVVVRGTMDETRYALHERGRDGRYRFVRGLHRVSPPGTIGVLVPPLEYHDFGNADDAVAHTVHVYGGDLTGARMFAQEEDGWWNARSVELHYDE